MYTSTICSASLRLRESRLLAHLLLQRLDRAEWDEKLFTENILQMSSVETIKKVSRLLRARLEPMGEGLWAMVHAGGKETATLAVFAGAIKESRLLGDFMDIALREQRAVFAERLEYRIWNEFMAGCRGRDPDMPDWNDSTLARARSAVFSMLAGAGYLRDTRSLLLQNVFVDSTLTSYLRARGEDYVVRCLEVAE